MKLLENELKPGRPSNIGTLLLGSFSPGLREAVLEDVQFRDRLGVSADAEIKFDQANVTFRRSVLFASVRKLFSSDMVEVRVEDTQNDTWCMSIAGAGTQIKFTSLSQSFIAPEFSYLHPDCVNRLKWFDSKVAEVGINDLGMRRWRKILEERSVRDHEVDELLKEFRLTPRHLAGVIENLLCQPTIDIGILVPDSLVYFDRLVGEWNSGLGLREFYQAARGPRNTDRIKQNISQGLKDAFITCAHPYGAQQLCLDNVPEEELLDFYRWLESGGDRISQIGGIEWGFRQLGAIPKLESHVECLVKSLLADKYDDKDGRLALLSGLIVMVEGELARTGIGRSRPPYWRRLASIAHASIIERAIVDMAVPPSELVSWIMDNRSLLYYLQTFVDMRLEPRWSPDFGLAEQLRAEFIGRIAGASLPAISFVKSEAFRKLLTGSDAEDIPAQVEFPFSFLPGPLEGGVEVVATMPGDIEAELKDGLQGSELTPASFVLLVNAALIFKIDAAFAELAADGLRRVKYQLRHIKSRDEAYNLLGGLATVAAVTRSPALADEVRVLMRVVRRKPDISISQRNAMRISLVAAAANANVVSWCKYVGSCITELSFEEMDRHEALVLKHQLGLLRQLEPKLWLTTSRADAAISAFLESFVA